MLIVVSGLNVTDRDARFARGEAGVCWSCWSDSKGESSATGAMAERQAEPGELKCFEAGKVELPRSEQARATLIIAAIGAVEFVIV